jgi:O-antigen/teichoic acid export membrane protein
MDSLHHRAVTTSFPEAQRREAVKTLLEIVPARCAFRRSPCQDVTERGLAAALLASTPERSAARGAATLFGVSHNTLRHVIAYVPGAVTPAVASFAMTVALARLLTSPEFGLFVAAWSVVTIAAASGAQWIVQAINRYNAIPAEEASGLQRAALRATCGSALVAALLSAAAFAVYSHWTDVGEATGSVLGGMALCAALGVTSLALLGLMQAEFRSRDYSLFQIRFQSLRTLGAITGGIAAATVGGVLVGAAVASIAVLAVYVPQIRVVASNSSATQARSWTLRVWRFGWPFIIWSMLSTFLAVGDRLMIGALLGGASIGNYSVHYALASGMATLLVTPLLLALHPEVMRRWSRSDEEGARQLVKVMAAVVGAVGISTSLASARWGSAVSHVLFGDDYASGATVLPILCIGVFTWQVALYVQKPLEARDKTPIMLVAMCWAVLINVAGNIALIPRLGILGAGIATVVSYVCYTLCLWALAWSPTAAYRTAVAAFAVAGCTALVSVAGNGLQGSGLVTLIAAVAFLPILLDTIRLPGMSAVRIFGGCGNRP